MPSLRILELSTLLSFDLGPEMHRIVTVNNSIEKEHK